MNKMSAAAATGTEQRVTIAHQAITACDSRVGTLNDQLMTLEDRINAHMAEVASESTAFAGRANTSNADIIEEMNRNKVTIENTFKDCSKMLEEMRSAATAIRPRHWHATRNDRRTSR